MSKILLNFRSGVKNFGLKTFPEISSDKISVKAGNFAGYTEIFGNFLPGISVPSKFPRGISRIFG